MVDDILAQTGRPEIARRQLARDIPLGRLGEPAEVAEMCVYLLSDESALRHRRGIRDRRRPDRAVMRQPGPVRGAARSAASQSRDRSEGGVRYDPCLQTHQRSQEAAPLRCAQELLTVAAADAPA